MTVPRYICRHVPSPALLEVRKTKSLGELQEAHPLTSRPSGIDLQAMLSHLLFFATDKTPIKNLGDNSLQESSKPNVKVKRPKSTKFSCWVSVLGLFDLFRYG